MRNKRTEEHEIALTTEEMDERGREGIAIVATLADLTEEVRAKKKRLAALGEISRSGKERRAVEVYDRENTPALEIDTLRVETGEVLATRKMSEAEVQNLQAKLPENNPQSRQHELPLAHGGGASSRRDPTPEEIHDKLAAGIRQLCDKPRDEKWLLAQLTKGVPESSAEDRKRAVTLHVESGRLAEQPDGKLLWIGNVSTGAADAAAATH